jgi:hypothetical protein
MADRGDRADRAERQDQDEREGRDAPKRGLGDLPIIGGLFRQVRLIVILLVVAFGGTAACAIFAPPAFRSVIDFVRNTGFQGYVLILGTQGREALKVVTYEVDVTGIGRVERQMGPLGLIFGENATVEGQMRVSLGADLQERKFGVLSCEVDTSSIRTTVGRRPLAGTAFDPEQIEQQAYTMFKETAAQQAISKYWPEAKRRLEAQFTTWALGLEVPTVPTLSACPVFVPPSSVQATPTP